MGFLHRTDFTINIRKSGSDEDGGGRTSITLDDQRIAVGNEEEEKKKERKRWVRPPLEGQAASTSPINQVKDSDDDSFEEDNPAQPKDFGLEKPRGPSPGSVSSLTSIRPLEWDSGADVGYYQYGDHPQGLMSTLERLALGGANMLTRGDPEGTTERTPNQVSVLGPPDAESTRCSPSVSNVHIYPEVVINEHQVSDSDVDCSREQRKNPIDEGLKKSSSLELIADPKAPEGPSTFPRCQSHTNLNILDISVRLQKMLRPETNSNSSVATVVKGPAQKEEKPSGSDSGGLSVEGRANSFEYLPGAVYESSAAPPGGTSFPDDDPLKQDVERGVRLLSEFMKGTNANNTILKEKLLKKVVEGILSKKYPGDESWDSSKSTKSETSKGTSYASGSSWQKGKERCVTRRGNDGDRQNRVMSEESNSQKSLMERMENSYVTSGTSSSLHSSSSLSSSKTSGVALEQSPISQKSPARDTVARASEPSRSDWKAHPTRAERLHEKNEKVSKTPKDPYLLQYLNSERENQLQWIQKEINHLSNLKQLLEKHETLKKNFARLKNAKNERRPKTAGVSRPSIKKIPAPYSEPDGDTETTWHSHDNYSTGGILKRNVSTNTAVSSSQFSKKTSITYTIIFDDAKSAAVAERENRRVLDRETLAQVSREKVKAQYSCQTLQDELQSKKPDYVARAESRRQIVAELGAIRELREQNRHQILASAGSGLSIPLPPNPLAVKRVLSQRSMRKLTEKNYKKTSDVKKKQVERKKKEECTTNRIMADLFKRKLQKRVLKGETYLSNSVNVIST